MRNRSYDLPHDPSPDEFYGNEEGHTKRDIPKDSHCVLFDPKAQGKKDSGTVIDKIGKFGSGDMKHFLRQGFYW